MILYVRSGNVQIQLNQKTSTRPLSSETASPLGSFNAYRTHDSQSGKVNRLSAVVSVTAIA